MDDNERQRDYDRLRKKYEIAEKHLFLNPDRYGGEEYIRGYLGGMLEGMVLLNPNLKSMCMEVSNEKS